MKKDKRIKEIERIMHKEYFLNPNDYDLQNVSLHKEETAREWCNWYARKHELTNLKKIQR